MHILLTNDDGLKAPGLQTLKRELASHDCRLTVVAPNGQRSAASHSMTINKALYCRDESTVPGIRYACGLRQDGHGIFPQRR